MGFLEFFNGSMSFRVQGLGFHRMLRMVQGGVSEGSMRVGAFGFRDRSAWG